MTEQSRFQPTYSILGATTELIRCRLTMKNFAWNEHWLMFIPYGVLKEVRAAIFSLRSCSRAGKLFDMMLPVIFGVSLYGEKLNWKPQRKVCPFPALAVDLMPPAAQRFFTTILPLITVAFMFLWHAGLGQPGVLRATPVGSAYFSVGTVACYSEVGADVRLCAAPVSHSCRSSTAQADGGWRKDQRHLVSASALSLQTAQAKAGSFSSSAYPSCFRHTSTRESCSPSW